MKTLCSLSTAITLAALAVPLFASAPPAGEKHVRAAEIIFADSGNAVEGGFVIRVDPLTGEDTVLARGGHLDMPFDVTTTKTGQIVVSDQGRLIAIDRNTGEQFLLADRSPLLGYPIGLTTARNGDIIVANTLTLLRVDPRTGAQKVISAGGYLHYPIDVAESSEADLIVLNLAWPHEILRVHSRTGAQAVLTCGGYLRSPQAVAVAKHDIYVTDVATPDGNFGEGRIIRINARSGAQSIVSQGGYLVGPVGIAINDADQLIIGDPYTVNPESLNLYDGAIIQVDPLTGHQVLIARGHAGYQNPRGVAVLPDAGARPPQSTRSTGME